MPIFGLLEKLPQWEKAVRKQQNYINCHWEDLELWCERMDIWCEEINTKLKDLSNKIEKIQLSKVE